MIGMTPTTRLSRAEMSDRAVGRRFSLQFNYSKTCPESEYIPKTQQAQMYNDKHVELNYCKIRGSFEFQKLLNIGCREKETVLESSHSSFETFPNL